MGHFHATSPSGEHGGADTSRVEVEVMLRVLNQHGLAFRLTLCADPACEARQAVIDTAMTLDSDQLAGMSDAEVDAYLATQWQALIAGEQGASSATPRVASRPGRAKHTASGSAERRGRRGKYLPLCQYLERRPAEQHSVQLALVAIAALIGAILPPSAAQASYWSGGPVAATNWRRVGWRARLKRPDTVLFTRLAETR